MQGTLQKFLAFILHSIIDTNHCIIYNLFNKIKREKWKVGKEEKVWMKQKMRYWI